MILECLNCGHRGPAEEFRDDLFADYKCIVCSLNLVKVWEPEEDDNEQS